MSGAGARSGHLARRAVPGVRRLLLEEGLRDAATAAGPEVLVR
ncbi:hypothetical protein RHIZO_03989 [Rhizobiaceae bacterium]|nr:hypothetical protein RHIZO_03989 [Rhizobiaceae bacterium]